MLPILAEQAVCLLLAFLEGEQGLSLPCIRLITGIERLEARDMGLDVGAIGIALANSAGHIGRVQVPVGCLKVRIALKARGCSWANVAMGGVPLTVDHILFVACAGIDACHFRQVIHMVSFIPPGETADGCRPCQNTGKN